MKREKRCLSKPWRLFFRLFGSFVLIGEILLAGLSVVPRLFDLTPYMIISDSMFPTLKAGDVVFVAYGDPSAYEINDLICFYMDETSSIPTTHRIVENDQANRLFMTKGDNNPSEDIRSIPYDQVVGEVRFHLPFLGYVMEFTGDILGKIVFVLLFLAALICLELG